MLHEKESKFESLECNSVAWLITISKFVGLMQVVIFGLKDDLVCLYGLLYGKLDCIHNIHLSYWSKESRWSNNWLIPDCTGHRWYQALCLGIWR